MMTVTAATTTGKPAEQNMHLFETAQKFESVFLAEMLTYAGFGKSRGEFGGGIGEDQFSSLLVAQQADAIVAAGGIGLAEALFEAMVEQSQ
nr:rod-binding protein [Poseidonocella sedimentorum]